MGLLGSFEPQLPNFRAGWGVRDNLAHFSLNGEETGAQREELTSPSSLTSEKRDVLLVSQLRLFMHHCYAHAIGLATVFAFSEYLPLTSVMPNNDDS